MAKINALDQIQPLTITDALIAPGAAIALSKLAEAVIQADGGQGFTNDQSFGGHKAINGANPTNAQDFVTKVYADAGDADAIAAAVATALASFPAFSILTNGDPAAPELIFGSDGDVIVTSGGS